jgi:hypothetical protein
LEVVPYTELRPESSRDKLLQVVGP